MLSNTIWHHRGITDMNTFSTDVVCVMTQEVQSCVDTPRSSFTCQGCIWFWVTVKVHLWLTYRWTALNICMWFVFYPSHFPLLLTVQSLVTFTVNWLKWNMLLFDFRHEKSILVILYFTSVIWQKLIGSKIGLSGWWEGVKDIVSGWKLELFQRQSV